MIDIINILNKSNIMFIKDTLSKKKLFSVISDKASDEYHLNKEIFFNTLYKRERIGSTSVGNGIAIPHVLIDSLTEPKCIITILSKGIDFDSSDNANVDLIFLLLMPKSNKIENLQILASISRLVRNNELTNKLRGCKDPESAYAIFSKVLEDKAA